MLGRNSESKSVPVQSKLFRTSLIRETYRSLLATGRTYAAFTKQERAYVDRLVDRGAILDPMSGYGGLMIESAKIGIDSYNLEMNPPQHLWQVLTNRRIAVRMPDAIGKLMSIRKRKAVGKRTVCSDTFFPEECYDLLCDLLSTIEDVLSSAAGLKREAKKYAVALLLPFAGRICCCTPGDNSAHVKEGGICVLRDWQIDFNAYLEVLLQYLRRVSTESLSSSHENYNGDARTFAFPKKRFRSMLTSPPYPNHRDFEAIFRPENELLRKLAQDGRTISFVDPSAVIGTNIVSRLSPSTPTAPSAIKFMDKISTLKRTKQATYDDEVYYFPYLKEYFAALESAYANVSKAAAEDFLGYIVVVNNTHRGVVVPVAEAIVDIWKKLGFSSRIERAEESFHLGTKNPRAKGIRARHTEYVVEVRR